MRCLVDILRGSELTSSSSKNKPGNSGARGSLCYGGTRTSRAETDQALGLDAGCLLGKSLKIKRGNVRRAKERGYSDEEIQWKDDNIAHLCFSIVLSGYSDSSSPNNGSKSTHRPPLWGRHRPMGRWHRLCLRPGYHDAMAPILLGKPVLCLQGRGERYGPLLAGELRKWFQLPRGRPEISPFGRPGRHGPRHAPLRRESGAAVEVRLLPDSHSDYDSARLLTAQRTADREPLLLNPGEGRPEWHLIGISAGIFNAVTMATAASFGTLYDACIEAGRVYARLCNLTLVRSRAMEDRPGVWGCVVVDIAVNKLEKILEQFQHAKVTSSSHSTGPNA